MSTLLYRSSTGFYERRTLLDVLLFIYRLESSFRSFSRPVLHAAARVVQEMGKSRAAAFALGLQDIDEGAEVNTYSDNNDSYDPDINPTAPSEGSACIACTLLFIMSIVSSQKFSSW